MAMVALEDFSTRFARAYAMRRERSGKKVTGSDDAKPLHSTLDLALARAYLVAKPLTSHAHVRVGSWGSMPGIWNSQMAIGNQKHFHGCLASWCVMLAHN